MKNFDLKRLVRPCLVGAIAFSAAALSTPSMAQDDVGVNRRTQDAEAKFDEVFQNNLEELESGANSSMEASVLDISRRAPPCPTGEPDCLDSMGDAIRFERETTNPTQRALVNVLFEFGRVDLTPESVDELRGLCAALRKLPPVTLRLEAHTDSVGSSDYNLALSNRRAAHVASLLSRDCKQSSATIVAVGLGENRLLDGVDPEDGRQRRLEAFVMK